MAVSAVYPYKCADILPGEISRNCLITGYVILSVTMVCAIFDSNWPNVRINELPT